MRFFLSWLSVLPLFFPLYLIRFEVAGIPTTLFEVMVGLTVLWGGLLWVLHGFPRPQRAWFWLPFALFLGAATFSMLIVPEVTLDINGDLVASGRIAQGIWKGWIVMPALYFVMIAVISKNEAWWRRTFMALALSGVGLSAWALVQMVTGDYATWDGRASGPFESANYLSLYLGPLVVLAFHFVVAKKPVFKGFRWVSGGVFGLLLVALYGSQSYAAFIAVAAGIIAYFLWHPQVSGRYKARAVFAAVLFLSGVFLTQLGTPKFEQFLETEDRTSTSVRLQIYEVSWAMIRKNPILGIGLGQFQVQYQLHAHDVLGQNPYEWNMPHPHNLLLAFWLNTGLLGVVAMAWLVILLLVRRPRSEVVHLGIALLVVMLVHGLFDTPFFKNDLAYLWWLVLVMGV